MAYPNGDRSFQRPMSHFNGAAPHAAYGEASVDSPEFEARVRNMILNDSVPHASEPDPSENLQPSATGRGGSNTGSDRGPKRPTQAERKRGQSNAFNTIDWSESVHADTFNVTHGSHHPEHFRGDGPYSQPPYYQQADTSFRQPRYSRGPSENYGRYGYQAHQVQVAPDQPSSSQHGRFSHQYWHQNDIVRMDNHSIHSAHNHPGNFRGGPSTHFAGYNDTRREMQLHRPQLSQGRRLFDPTRRQTSDNLPPYQHAAYLDTLVTQNVSNIGIALDEERNYEFLRRHLLSVIQNALQRDPATSHIPLDSIQLPCFGSLASGFGTKSSDMDLMVFYHATSLTEDQQKLVPRVIEKALLDQGHGARLLTKTRIPIIRFCSSPSAELFQALRAERLKWELEKEKIAGDNPDHSGQQNGDHDAERQHNRAENPLSKEVTSQAEAEGTNKVGPGEVTHDTAVQPLRASGVVEKPLNQTLDEDGGEKNPPPPLPYKNDEERIHLYRLAIKEDWYSPEERRLIENYAKAFDRSGGRLDNPELVRHREALSSLPDVLSRYRESRKRRQELEFPEGSGSLCDINFAVGPHSNPLAVHNTRLLYCYSLFDHRIKEMVLFVKCWAKQRGINKPYHGTLSSYGYVLMVLHYVVNIVNPPLAPNLQLWHARNSASGYQAPETCGEFDIRFWQDPEAIKIAARQEFGQNGQSVGSLLAGFYRYYAVNDYRGLKGFEWMKDVLSLRTEGGILTKREKDWTGKWTQQAQADDDAAKSREITHRYLVAIEDPFEHLHNVGRPVMHHGIVAIREEFRRANQLIFGSGFMNGRTHDFFELGEDRVREQRLFGPNPKHKNNNPKATGAKNLAGEARNKQHTQLASPTAGSKDALPTQTASTPAAAVVAAPSNVLATLTNDVKLEASTGTAVAASNPTKAPEREVERGSGPRGGRGNNRRGRKKTTYVKLDLT